MEDKFLNGRGLTEYTVKVKEKMAFIDGDSVTNKNPVLDLFYPVGSHFKTTNTSFNPNTTWGGTWVEDTDLDIVAYAKTNGTTIVAGKNISGVSKSSDNIYKWTLSKALANTDGIIQATCEVSGAPNEIVGAYWTGTSSFNTDCGDHTGTMRGDVTNWYITVRGKLATPEYKKWRRTA